MKTNILRLKESEALAEELRADMSMMGRFFTRERGYLKRLLREKVCSSNLVKPFGSSRSICRISYS